MLRRSGRKRKARVISDIGSPLRNQASGSRRPDRLPKKVHGNVKGEREVRYAVQKRSAHLNAHIDKQRKKVCVGDKY